MSKKNELHPRPTLLSETVADKVFWAVQFSSGLVLQVSRYEVELLSPCCRAVLGSSASQNYPHPGNCSKCEERVVFAPGRRVITFAALKNSGFTSTRHKLYEKAWATMDVWLEVYGADPLLAILERAAVEAELTAFMGAVKTLVVGEGFSKKQKQGWGLYE